MDEVVTSWGIDTSTGQQVVSSSQEEVLDSKLKRKMTQASNNSAPCASVSNALQSGKCCSGPKSR